MNSKKEKKPNVNGLSSYRRPRYLDKRKTIVEKGGEMIDCQTALAKEMNDSNASEQWHDSSKVFSVLSLVQNGTTEGCDVPRLRRNIPLYR